MAQSPQSLQGSVALVTGAAQGIGRAIAARLASDGALVAINDRVDDEAMQATVTHTGGIPAPADISDRDQIDGLVHHIRGQAGDVDVLVANAAYMAMAPFL